MPTPLGALPLSGPPPVGDAQVSWGGWDGVERGVGYDWTVPSILPDGSSGGWQISYAAVRDCYWIVEAQMMVMAQPAGGWVATAYAIRLNQADADGVVLGPYMYTVENPAINWRCWNCAYPFRLSAGKTYTAYIRYEGGLANPNWSKYYCHGGFGIGLSGLVIGDGVV
jgi:hypothetical protein